ncbi:MAG: GNAT family N-acetyltransferase [Planctomycetaceae bacterium]
MIKTEHDFIPEGNSAENNLRQLGTLKSYENRASVFVYDDEIEYRICGPDELTPSMLNRWEEIQERNPDLDSPFFRPEYMKLVSRVRKDMDVVLIEQGGKVVGFFPFHRDPYNVGRPVGYPLNDFQGIVVEKKVEIDERELLEAASLKAWKFDHGLAVQQELLRNSYSQCGSAFLDLKHGFEGYQAERKKAGSSLIKQTTRKKRNLERDHGELKFIPHTTDPEVFNTLLEWKQEQYLRTGKTNTFKFRWPRELLELILEQQTPQFQGRLSALYAGNKLVAIDYGVQSYGVLNSWFPAYNQEFSSYSPGHVLLLEMAKACREMGIKRIDLGKGDESYKTRYASGMTRLTEGSFETNPLSRELQKQWYRTRDWARTSAWGEVLRYPVRLLKPIRERLHYGDQEK